MRKYEEILLDLAAKYLHRNITLIPFKGEDTEVTFPKNMHHKNVYADKSKKNMALMKNKCFMSILNISEPYQNSHVQCGTQA